MPSAMLTQDEKRFSMNWGASFHEDTQCAMTFILDFFDSIIIINVFPYVFHLVQHFFSILN